MHTLLRKSVHPSVKVGHYALQFGRGHAVTPVCAANKKQVLVSRCLWIYTIKSEWQVVAPVTLVKPSA
jgi:hypothetical protein